MEWFLVFLFSKIEIRLIIFEIYTVVLYFTFYAV